MSRADLSEVYLERFLGLHPKKIDLSLDRISPLLAKLGHPELHLPPTIHVAGTNGKGSTIAFMRAILEAAGFRVHVYTSPHLVRFHERIRLGAKGGGKLVDDKELTAALAACEVANGTDPITFFEIITSAAFKLFHDHPADFLLLEVGLGGRYDATNVIQRPFASVITPVSIDHPEFLGNTVDQIADEKAGIIKAGVPVIASQPELTALAVIEREAAKMKAPLIVAGQDFSAREEHGRLVYEDTKGLIDLPLPRLAGRHQHQNAATAIAALRTVVPGLSHMAYEQGLLRVEWPARLQRIAKGRIVEMAPPRAEIWLDGGHNEAGGKVVAEAMADFEDRSQRPLALICGSLATKDTVGFLRSFTGLAQEVLAVPVEGEHAARPATEVAAAAIEVGMSARVFDSVEAALQALKAQSWSVPPRILITGSLYLCGAVLQLNGTPPQ